MICYFEQEEGRNDEPTKDDDSDVDPTWSPQEDYSSNLSQKLKLIDSRKTSCEVFSLTSVQQALPAAADLLETPAMNLKVMERIAQDLDILQGYKEMYLGFLLPTLTVVKSTLTSLSELQWCDPLKLALLKVFEKRFSKYFENPEFEIDACLVPRFKLNWVPQMAERQSIRNSHSAEFLKIVKKEHSATTKTAGNNAPQESKNTKIDKFFP